MKTGLFLILGLLAAGFSLPSHAQEPVQVKVVRSEGRYAIKAGDREIFVKGVGGTNNLDVAAANGANACRTWGGNASEIRRTIEAASASGMYIMQGIWLPKEQELYSNSEWKAKMLQECRNLAREFRGDPNILIWGIGNEIELDKGAGAAEAWRFVDEIAREMRAIDPYHLYSTVISYNKDALDAIARYAPSLDIVGINCYGGIDTLAETVRCSEYDGPYMVTEWGPTGWWEIDQTSWGAPLEQTSEEKRRVYEERYRIIASDPACTGSFCFLWGQKEERTPTWFCMFVEHDVEGLPLNGEKTPMVEAMERCWTGREPARVAPVIGGITAGRRLPGESATFAAGQKIRFAVEAKDRDKDIDRYVWEVLREATVTATGGAWEPRPDRVGEVHTTSSPSIRLTFDEPGNYRVYVYVLDKAGFASTANIPVRISGK
mgnify:CR=1 FL=1